MEGTIAHPRSGSGGVPLLPWLAAVLSLAAAGIHFAAAPDHFDEYWMYGWFFIAVGWLQAIWAVAVVGYGSRSWLFLGGVCLNLLVVAIWVWSRTAGIPVGPESGATEAVAWPDLAASGAALAVVVLALVVPFENPGPPPATPDLVRDSWSWLWLAGAAILLGVLVGAVIASSGSGHHDDPSLGGHTEAGDE